jgi:flagellar motor protein MotB
LEPLATNETEAGRQLNRRIEVAIFAGAKARSVSP